MHLLQLQKSSCDPKHVDEEKPLDDNFPRWSPVREEILWPKKPWVREESSVPNQEGITMCSRIIRKIPTVKSVWKQTQHEPGAGWILRRAGMGLHLLQHSETWSRQRVKMRTQKRCNRARWLHELDPELSDANERNIVSYVVFTKISSSVTEARKNLHGQFQMSLWKLVKICIGIMTQALLIAHKRKEWQKERPQSERRNSYRTSAKWTTWRMVGLRNAIVTCATLTTKWPMTKQHSRKAVAKKLTDHQYPLDHWLNTPQLPPKTSREYISVERNRWKEYSWALCYVRAEVGQDTWWQQIMKICKDQKPQTSKPKDSKAKEYSFKQITNFFVRTEL